MKIAIQPDPFVDIALLRRLIARIRDLAEAHEIRVATIQDRELRGKYIQRHPHGAQLLDGRLVEYHHFRLAIRVYHHQAFIGQPPDRFPDRRAAHAEQIRETLFRKFLATLDLPREDHLQDSCVSRLGRRLIAAPAHRNASS
jgi:hypothetical protein